MSSLTLSLLACCFCKLTAVLANHAQDEKEVQAGCLCTHSRKPLDRPHYNAHLNQTRMLCVGVTPTQVDAVYSYVWQAAHWLCIKHHPPGCPGSRSPPPSAQGIAFPQLLLLPPVAPVAAGQRPGVQGPGGIEPCATARWLCLRTIRVSLGVVEWALNRTTKFMVEFGSTAQPVSSREPKIV